jgi:DNA-binding FrmR family transcriptional regulator
MSQHLRPDVRARLARASGHLDRVVAMMDDGRPYAEVLHQLAAVRAALDRAAAVAVDDILHACEERCAARDRVAIREARVAIKTLG